MSYPISVEFESEITEAQARKALANFDGITVVDNRENGGYITPIECVKEDDVFVSRLRKTQPLNMAFLCGL